MVMELRRHFPLLTSLLCSILPSAKPHLGKEAEALAMAGTALILAAELPHILVPDTGP